MAVLVTGAAGFIGSHVCQNLVTAASVVAVDKLSYCSSLRNVPTQAAFIQGDVTDYRFVETLFREHDITQVVHLAAESHVDNSFKSPRYFMQNNLGATQTLADVACSAGVARFLHFSTDEVYGPCDYADETSPMAPTNPYAASKAASEVLLGSYAKCYGLPLVTIRSNNAFGPFQYPEKIIPKFIKRLRAGKPCIVHGRGTHMRSYIYVSDVAAAVQCVLEKGIVGETYNLGTEIELSNLEVAETLTAELRGPPVEFGGDRLFNDSRYKIGYDKLKALGWVPRVSFEQGLRMVLDTK